jgi:NADPH:quinone reductase
MPLQLRTEIKSNNTLELSLVDVPMPEPADDEVVVRIEATPINPSDLGLLFGAADMKTAIASGTADRPVVTADVPEKLMRAMGPRIDQSIPAGNEGAGVVVAAGASDEAQALMGKLVGAAGGAMYGQYRAIKAALCLAMPEGTTPADAASCFVNPLTALSFPITMETEGHKALIHTAAASNLGQMLVKICKDDGVDLVNIVRKKEQEDLLRGLGAKYVVNSSSENFMAELIDAIAETGATIAFDATGGGDLTNSILTAMEIAANKNATEYSRYGSDTFKQVYIYGGLNRNPTTLTRGYGTSWSIGGYLLTPFLQKAGIPKLMEMQKRVADEITTTFKSTYTKQVSLAEVLSLEAIAQYGKQATGEKYLINPSLDG